MKQLKGLYICVILIMAVSLLDFTVLSGEYSGIATFASVILFLVATLFFINASHRMKDAGQ